MEIKNDVSVEKRDSEFKALSDAWKSDVKRLIRRAEISKQLNTDLSLEEIAGAVREHEKKLNVGEMVESLLSVENTVSPRMAKIASELSIEIRKKHTNVKAVVLLGSGAHGGALIREATRGFQ